VFCPKTRDIIQVPADSPVPNFISLSKTLQEVREGLVIPNAISLAPRQTVPSGWIVVKKERALPVAYPPIEQVAVPKGFTATHRNGWIRRKGVAGSTVYSPKAAASSLEGRRIMIAAPPGQRMVRLESDSPIQVPNSWPFAAPKAWTIATYNSTTIVAVPPGMAGKKVSDALPKWRPSDGRRMRFYAGIGWTDVPD
jgi:hypothetical protein